MKTLAAALPGIVLLTRLALAVPPDIQPIPDWVIAEDTMLSVEVSVSDPDTPTLIYWVEVSNTHINASFDVENMEVHVTPAADWNGVAQVTVGVDDMDGSRTMDEETFTVTVTPVNDCPHFLFSTPRPPLSTPEDVCLEIPFNSLRASFNDPDWLWEGDALSYLNPVFNIGTVETTATGWRLCAPANFHGSGRLDYQATDGDCVVAGWLNITVVSVNDCPAQDQTWALQLGMEDQPLVVNGLLQHWSDVEGSALSYVGFTGGAPGFSASWNAQSGALTILPPADWNGSDVLSLQVSDGACTTTAPLSLELAAVNDAPRLTAPAALELDEDTPLEASLAIVDVDGPALAVTVESSAPELAVSWLAGVLTLTPAADWNGAATVTVRACDGFAAEACSEAQVAVTVRPVNDGPVIQPIADVTFAEDSQRGVDVQLGDIDSQNLAVSVATSTPELAAQWQAAQQRVLLTPVADWNGEALVTVSVDDQDGRAVAQASFNAAVSPVNDAPVLAQVAPLELDEDASLASPFAAADVDGPTLTVAVESSAPELATSWLAGELTLTPAADWNGAATVTVRACDGADPELCVTAEIPVTVHAINDGPGIQPIADVDFAEDGVRFVDVQVGDIDSQNLVVSVATSRPELTAQWQAAQQRVLLTPATDWNGEALVTVSVDDQDGRAVAQASFNAVVTPVNDAPVLAQAAPLELDEDASLTSPFAAADVDGPTLTVTVESSASGLVASWLAGELTLTPAADWNGAATVTVRACDGADPGLCVTAEIPVTVRAVNDAPVLAQAQPLELDEDASLTSPFAAADVDGPALVVTAESSAPGLAVSWLAGELTLTPAANWNGAAVVTVRACDGADPELCATAEIPVTVHAVNDGPGIAPIVDVEFAEDGQALVPVQLADLDSPELLVTVATDNPALVAEWQAAQSRILLTPAADWHGAATVTVNVDDLAGRAVAQTGFGVVVTPVNDAPVLAQVQPLELNEDASLTAPFAAADVDGPALHVTVESSVPELAASWLAGELTLAPAADWNGAATVTVRACDGADPELCVAAAIPVTVQAVNDAPVLPEAQALAFMESETLTTVFPVGDVDGPALVVTAESSAPELSASWSAGELFLQAAADWNGAATVTVRACDGAEPELCVAVAFPVTVLPFNNYPVIQPVADVEFAEDSPAQVPLQISDVDSNDLLVTVTTDNPSLAAQWQLVESSVRLTPAADWNGAAQVTIHVDDQYGRSVSEATFNAVVTPVNDAPVLPAVQPLETMEDTPLLAPFPINDVDGPALTVTVESSAPELAASWLPESGELSLAPGQNWSGAATLTVTACDDASPEACTQAMVPVVVMAVNDAPEVDPIADQFLDEDTTVWVPLVVHDEDSQDIIVTADTGREELTVTWEPAESRLLLTPAADWSGTARVKLTISDERSEGHLTIAFMVTVAPVNDAPVLPATAELALVEDEALELDYPVTDVDGPSLTMTAVSDTSAVSAVWLAQSGRLQVTPAGNWNGVATLTLTACDGHEGSEACVERQIAVTVAAVNDAPVIETVAEQRLAEDDVVEVPVSINDADGGAWSVTVASDRPALAATWLAESGRVRLAPAPDWHGTAVVTVSADDGAGRTVTQATFQVQVLPVNDAPYAQPCGEWVCGTVEDPAAFRELLLNGGLMLDVADVDGNALRLTWFVNGVEASHHIFSAGADTLRCWSLPAPPAELIDGALSLHAELSDGVATVNPGGEACAWELDFTGLDATEPARFALGPGYPNPFNPSARLPYSLAQPGAARLTIYDLRGAQVAVLVEGWQTAGAHEVVWNAGGQASGVYLAVLEAEGRRLVERLTLLK